MKAALLTGIKEIAISQIPQPKIKTDRDVLIKIAQVGICGSDIHYYKTGRIGPQIISFPFIIGHEAAGTVVRVGSQVTRVKKDDRIAIDPAIYCQKCDQCVQGRENTCQNLLFMGCPGQRDGCLCEYIVLPEICCFPLDEKTSFTQAIISEPLAVAIYAVERSLPVAGKTAGILGAGPMGICVLTALKAKKIEQIYITDILSERLDFAQKYHPHWCGNPLNINVEKEICQRQPLLLDLVFECSGSLDAYEQAWQLLKPGGLLVIIGIPEVDNVSFPIHLLRRKEIDIINIRRQAHCTQSAIELSSDNTTKLGQLVSHHFSLDQTAEAFSLVSGYADSVMKAIITID